MARAKKLKLRKEHQAGKGTSASGADHAKDSSSGSETKVSPNLQSPPSAWDGNRDPESASRSRRSSDASARAGRRSPSTGRRSPSTGRGDAGQHQALAIQANRQPIGIDSRKLRNLDLSLSAWCLINRTSAEQVDAPRNLPKRPKEANSSGREVLIKLNSFNVIQFPTKPVYQYDVLIGSGVEKRGLLQKIWDCETVKKALGPGWIYDGNKVAWSLRDHDKQLTLNIDLDREQGRVQKPGQKSNCHRVQVRKSGIVGFQGLRAYLERKTDHDNSVIEAISFLDHLMRQTPSQNYISIKRNFFNRGEIRTILGAGVEAFKGVYASVRTIIPEALKQPCLSVNVDVANTTFWTESALHQTVQQLVNANDVVALKQKLRSTDGKIPPAFRQLDKLKKLRVYVKHRGLDGKDRITQIHRCIPKDANTWKFEWEEAPGKKRLITVKDYFLHKYSIRLQHPELPLVKTVSSKSKENDESTWLVHPMECLYIVANQRYPFKLSERQTSEMIKFAVTVPEKRWQAVEHGLRMFNWQEDPYLVNYGLKIDSKPATVKARVLQNPKVVFGPGSKQAAIDPRTTGRWDLKDKKFLRAGEALVAWGVCILPGRTSVTVPQAKDFMITFMNVLQGHGMKIENKQPIIRQGVLDTGEAVSEIFNEVGNKNNRRPQFLMFIVPDKDSHTYMRIKKSCDCRWGVVSQVVQSAHVLKGQAQYCSNVAMKVNAKLGGVTARAESIGISKKFKVPTLVIGADVSHGSPGSDTASIAAMTVSLDKEAVRYGAAVETNGSRVEIITPANIESMLKPLVHEWMTTVSGGSFPHHIIYFRDGVSEGQYPRVLSEEVQEIENLFRAGNAKIDFKFTVIIATKRHHVRFFPEKGAGDKNGNAFPGTLVEFGVTHPFEYDFYLCAHSAIKGTARPVHYHVIRDDINVPVSILQGLIYEHSYQYVRSTTPVSLFPAIYYAHLASNRGLHHIDEKSGSHPKGPKTGNLGRPSDDGNSKEGELKPTEVLPLLPMPNMTRIRSTMWFV